MADNIFILSQTAAAATFTANTGETAVDLSAGADTTGKLYNGFGHSKHKNSNITLLSAGYSLPFGFEFEKNSDNEKYFSMIEIGINNGSNQTINKVILPFRNYEISIGQYLDIAHYGEIYFWARFPNMPKISMLNVPSGLNNKVFYCPIFIKINTSSSMYDIF